MTESLFRHIRSGEWFGAGEYEPTSYGYTPSGNYGPVSYSRTLGWPLRWWLLVKWAVRRG